MPIKGSFMQKVSVFEFVGAPGPSEGLQTFTLNSNVALTSGFRLSGSPSSLQFTSEGLHSWTGSAYGLSVEGPTDTQTLLIQPGDPAVELLS